MLWLRFVLHYADRCCTGPELLPGGNFFQLLGLDDLSIETGFLASASLVSAIRLSSPCRRSWVSLVANQQAAQVATMSCPGLACALIAMLRADSARRGNSPPPAWSIDAEQQLQSGIHTPLQQVCSKRMSQGMTTRRFVNVGLPNSKFNCTVEYCFHQSDDAVLHPNAGRYCACWQERHTANPTQQEPPVYYR